VTQPVNMEQLVQTAQYAAANSRKALEILSGQGAVVAGIKEQLSSVAKEHDALLLVLKQLSAQRTGGNPNLQYIENVPGRRIPFDYLVDIPIGNNVNSVQQGTITISQEGPFVAVARYATFLSQYQFQRTDPVSGAAVAFQGRSYGRYRPIASVWDIQDGTLRSQVTQAEAFPGTGSPHVLSPSNGSPFRTMQQDMRIKVEDAGSSFPRSNIEVPSTFWSTEINSPFQLGALDFFERNSVITFKVLPLHVNNPSFGNIQSFGAPNANFPFLASGWDYVEGINDQNDAAAGATDPIVRLPNGILTIGFHGYRIIQGPGAGPY